MSDLRKIKEKAIFSHYICAKKSLILFGVNKLVPLRRTNDNNKNWISGSGFVFSETSEAYSGRCFRIQICGLNKGFFVACWH